MVCFSEPCGSLQMFYLHGKLARCETLSTLLKVMLLQMYQSKLLLCINCICLLFLFFYTKLYGFCNPSDLFHITLSELLVVHDSLIKEILAKEFLEIFLFQNLFQKCYLDTIYIIVLQGKVTVTIKYSLPVLQLTLSFLSYESLIFSEMVNRAKIPMSTLQVRILFIFVISL